MELYFVTSNKGKVREAEAILGLPIKIANIELPEIQSLDLHVIVKAKVKAAYEQVKKPVFVDDVGLFVGTWNGFPGPFIKFMRMSESYDNNLLLRMMKGESSRDVVVKDVIGYYDGRTLETFEGEVTGRLTTEERGDDGWGFDPIFEPEGRGLTFAELGENEKNKISHRRRALEKFKEYLQRQKLS
ncbi:XTP/dITP diphosphatase [soil metagenome]